MKRTVVITLALVTALAMVPQGLAGGSWVKGKGGSSGGSSGGGGDAAIARPGYGYYGYPGYRGYYGGYYGAYWGWPYYYGPYWYAPYPYYGPVAVSVPVEKSVQRPGAVETSIKPKKAQVIVDGTPVGQARDFNGPWDLLLVAPGTRSLEFQMEGYQTLRVNVEAKSGGYYRIQESLLRGEGLDPRSHEPPPPAPPEPAVAAAPAVAPARPDLDEEPGPRATSGGIRPGHLTIRATPADAAVYLDGEFLGSAAELARLHGGLPVAEGSHTIEVVHPGYQGRTVEVNVEAGTPEKVQVDLPPKP